MNPDQGDYIVSGRVGSCGKIGGQEIDRLD